MSQCELVKYDVSDRLATITLNRPESRNSLNQALRLQLAAAVKQASADDNVRVILIAAAGKSFCAGADLTEQLPGAGTAGFITAQIMDEYGPMIQSIRDAVKPVIAVINGAAAGIGVGLALACDLLMMADDALIYSAFGAISLIPDGGLHHFLLESLGSKKAYEMIAFSQRLSAQECLAAGIANRVVPAGKLQDEARQWASLLADQAPLTLKVSKRLLQKVTGQPLDYCMEQEALMQDALTRSEDFAEGCSAYFEKRKPEFKGR